MHYIDKSAIKNNFINKGKREMSFWTYKNALKIKKIIVAKLDKD